MNENREFGSRPPLWREETVYAGAKINLFLFITGRLPNGYHELSTLFLPVSQPKDTLIFSPADRSSGIRVRCDVEGIDLERNTLTRAYELYAQASGFAPAVDVELIKGIPHGAGLGGGHRRAPFRGGKRGGRMELRAALPPGEGQYGMGLCGVGCRKSVIFLDRENEGR